MRTSEFAASRPDRTGESAPKTATNWVFFWLVAGIQMMKDALDLLWGALSAVGFGLSATGAGAVVGIPIALFSIGMSFIIALFVFMITLSYFAYAKKSMGIRLVITSIGVIMGMIPGVNLLPETTIAFFLGFFFENIIKKLKKI